MKHIYTFFAIAVALLSATLAVNAQNDGNIYNSQGGVSTSKNVSGPDGQGWYTISLETFATGTSALIETGIPVDIVLVLDVSGSMNDNLATTYSYTARANQGYSYNSYGNNTYYYLHTDGNYYPVSRDHDGVWLVLDFRSNFRLSFQVNNTTYYLSGSGVTTTMPTNYDDDDDIIWTGVLYTRTQNPPQTKLQALKSAVRSFVNTVHNDALYDKKGNLRGTPLSNQISVVKYAMNQYVNTSGTVQSTSTDPYGATGYNVITPGNHFDGSYNATEVFVGFTDVSTSTGVNTVMGEGTLVGVDDLSYGGATASDFGMTKARYLLETVKNRESNKVVVLFTDGSPTYQTNFDSTVANNTIDIAKTLKNTYGATVFTIGVFDDETNNIRTYMNRTSSNYPDAVSMTNEGSGGSDKGYYQNASGADLSAIFKDIAGQAASSDATIGAQTQVRDVVSNSFTLPNNVSPENITVASWDIMEDGSGWENETGLVNGEDITININTVTFEGEEEPRKQVVVEGFDYSKDDTKNADGFTVTPGNWVGKRYFSQTDIRWKGKKLVISFKVRANGDATGGAGTNTNHPSSGVYVYNPETQTYSSVNSYPIPHTTLPLILKIQKDGLRHGESATFEIHRADPLMEVVKDKDGNVIKSKIDPTKDSLRVVYNAIGKPMPDMTTDGNWSKVILTNKGGDGDPVTKVLMALDPNYVYSIIEDDWGFGYELTGESSTLTTSDVEVNPFIFHNRLKEGTVKHAEAVSINHFATGSNTGDAYTEDYQSSKVSSFTTPATGGGSRSSGGSKGKK